MSTVSTANPSTSSANPIPEALLALAPLELPNHRHSRYGGDDLCLSLDNLAVAD